jgi:hypothetical protein
MMETLEERALFSTTYATMVLEAPHSPAPFVQVDQNRTPSPVVPGATLASVLDLQLRIVSGGLYLTAAVSGLNTQDPAPTGTVDFYSDAGYIGTVALGTLSQADAYRNLIVLQPGDHTIFAQYFGDANYFQSQNSIERTLTFPTSTLPKSASQASAFVTNTAKVKERVRPMRALSKLPYGTTGNVALPSPRFSPVSFSIRR